MTAAAAPTGTPVAVVGIGCRFPGAYGPAQLWRLLERGGDAVTEVPASRWDVDAWYDPRPGTPNRIVTRRGGFLDRIDEFDAGFFGVSAREADELDPQQRLLLETAAEALDDAGLTPGQLAAQRAGVFVGAMASSYWEMLSRAGILDIYAASGGARSMLSGRLSYAFDLRGPSVTLDSACSSGLAALHLAVQAVRSGECAVALAGGVNLVVSAEETVPFSQAKMLAPDGHCKFAAAEADGFVRSEGVAVVVLKPLAAAEADGDLIHAVVHGSAVSNDGQSGGYLLTPSQPGQEETLRAAYASAGVDPALVDYVEAHGTGTPAGDPVELGALAAVLGAGRPADRPCLVGSVKTNIGHTEAAAGLAGFVKTVLALRHRRVPASLHAQRLTDRVDWSALPLVVCREAVDWPVTGRPGLAGVSSFGISGTNAHVVVGEYVPAAVPAPAPDAPGGAAPGGAAPGGGGQDGGGQDGGGQDGGGPDGGAAQVLVLSAPTPAGLAAVAGAYAEFLEPGGAGADLPLRDVCFSAATRRRHHEHRLTAVGHTAAEVTERLRSYLAGESRPRLGSAEDVDGPPRVVFVYPGQGSQWRGMGRELLAASAVFRDALTRCDGAIRAEAGWSLLDRLTGADDTPDTLDTIQPTLWAMETALTALLGSWGIVPDVIVGHSMGEVAAAGAAGVLDLADAAAVICRRSKLARRLSGQGAMVSVELSAQDALAELAGYEDRVSVAVSNSPTYTVLSGDPAALDTIVANLDDRGVFCRPVKVDFASHSPQVDLLRDDLLAELADLTPGPARIPFWSTVEHALLDGPGMDAAYWARNLRQPVRFGDAVAELAGPGPTVFVEVSPHPILLPAIREVLGDGPGSAIGCLRRDEPERASLLDTVAGLHRSGRAVSWTAVAGGSPPRYVRLPAYPWQRRSHWYTDARPTAPPPPLPTSTADAGWAGAGVGGAHPLVGALVRTAGGGGRWEGPLDPAAHPWLLDHLVQGTVVLPGTAYLEMVHAAARQLAGDRVPVLADVHYAQALFVPAGAVTTLVLALTPDGPDRWAFTVSSGADPADRTDHATGTVRLETPAAPAPLPLADLRAACPRHLPGADFYRWSAGYGNQWAGAFQGVAELWRGTDRALARIEPPAGLDLAGYGCHPAVLDACGQVLAALIPDDANTAFVLGGIDEVVFHPPTGRRAGWGSAVLVPSWRSDSVTGDITVADPDGAVLVELRGLRLQFLQPPAAVRDPRPWLHELHWLPAPPAAPAPAGGPRLVFGDRGGVGAGLGAAVLVSAAEAYRRVGPGAYELDPASAADHVRLLADVRAELGADPAEVVHLWSLDADPADPGAPAAELAAAAERVGAVSVLHLAQALGGAATPPRLWLVTRGAQPVRDTDPVSPWQAPVWGLGRTVAQELRDLRCGLVDLDPAGTPASDAAALAAALAAAGPEDQLALRGPDRYAARLVPAAGPAPVDAAYEVRTGEPGILDAIGLRPVERRAPGPGEVEVRAGVLALNYRDVLLAMGHYPTLDDRPPLFVGECAGTVLRVGPGVAGVRPGDEVIALALSVPAGTHLCVDANLVRPKPAGMLPQEAATLPVGFLTAYYSLVTLAALRHGERVLIHHATGGVGLAALQVARWRGAEVFATAGTPEKRAMLRMLGVRHVSDSRGLDFADEVLAATHGEGVDVVLNTLAGEGLEKSLSVLARRGRYVELSRRDLVEGTRLDLRLLARGVSLFVVDVVDLGLSAPREAGAVLDEVLALVAAGVFTPLPHQLFPAADLAGAFRHLARSRQIGKVLVSVEEVGAEPAPTPRPVRVDAAADYLVTGGLGELGRAVADWLVREGARHLVLTGRGAPTADTAAWLAGLRRHGVDVLHEPVDVADEDAMRAMLARHRAAGRPAVRGVVHAAGVIEYRAVPDTDAAVLSAVLRPKVTGGWVLHRLFERLDFFVLFSSGSAILSSPMLGAYAAANAGLDALADARRRGGAAALSVNWGFWSVGMPARAAVEQGRPITPQGMDTFSPREGIEALRLLLASDATHGVVLPADWPRWAAAYPASATAPLFDTLLRGAVPERRAVVPAPAVPAREPERPVVSTVEPPAPTVDRTPQPAPQAVPIAAGVAGTPTDRAAGPVGAGVAGTLTDRAAVEEYVRQVCAAVLGVPVADVPVRRPLKRQGLDSLMAVEVRTRVQRDLGLVLPIAKMLGGQSPADIAADVDTHLAGSRQPAR